MIIIFLTASTSMIFPVSGSIYEAKTSYFEYYHCSDNWHTYVKFSVEVWDSSEGIAVIRVTNESTTQDYRLKIPEWSLVDSEGHIIGRWPYCPIWLDVSSFESGMEFNDSNQWLFGFTVDIVGSTHLEIERTTPHDGFDVIECLYYNPEESRIEQYDFHTKYPDNTVYTTRLKYYPDVWDFSTTSTTQDRTDTTLTAYLVLGVVIELVVIVYLISRRISR